MQLRRWDPFMEMQQLQCEVDRLFGGNTVRTCTALM